MGPRKKCANFGVFEKPKKRETHYLGDQNRQFCEICPAREVQKVSKIATSCKPVFLKTTKIKKPKFGRGHFSQQDGTKRGSQQFHSRISDLAACTSVHTFAQIFAKKRQKWPKIGSNFSIKIPCRFIFFRQKIQ